MGSDEKLDNEMGSDENLDNGMGSDAKLDNELGLKREGRKVEKFKVTRVEKRR